MLTLGEQLILIALDPRKGTIRGSQVLRYGLGAATLAELLNSGLITLRRPDGRWGVTAVAGVEETESPHEVLADTWSRVKAWPEDRESHPDGWVRNGAGPSLDSYLEALRSRGVIDWDEPKEAKEPKARHGRFRLLDPAAAAAARARVDRVVRSGAAPDAPDARDRDLAGIAGMLGYGKVLYPGLLGRPKRTALARAIEKQRFAAMLARALPSVPELKFTFNSSRDLAMARAMVAAVNFDSHHSGGGHDGGMAGGHGGHGGHH
ncbi:GOLPH3/VPS74 family protein [Catenulispora subtropica]|uniref:GPP34 family phosphoprotein n=1 Tax=Catenulispora subtropica TaxID=450798 RepID=A0ABP5CU84_9ACTN